MVIMPDGAKFKNELKYITYVNHVKQHPFSIVPMYNGPDIVCSPNMENWEKRRRFLSLEEREEIIFLLEHLNWKRNLKIVEERTSAEKRKAFVQKGSLETTNAYAALARKIFLILTAS